MGDSRARKRNHNSIIPLNFDKERRRPRTRRRRAEKKGKEKERTETSDYVRSRIQAVPPAFKACPLPLQFEDEVGGANVSGCQSIRSKKRLTVWN